MREAQLTLVSSLAEAQQFMAWLGERRPVLAVDTETTGLKWWTKDFLRLIQFGDAESGWAIPAGEWLGVAREALLQYDGPIAMHNAQFDLHALDSAGLPLPGLDRLHDTKIMHSLAEPLSGHSLKRISERKYGPAAAVGERILKQAFAKNGWWWDTVPIEYEGYWAYACLDTVLTARIWEDMQGAAPAAAYEREMAVAYIMFEAEKRGLLIDAEYTEGLASEWLEEMLELELHLEQYGMANPNSRTQLYAALQAEIKFEPGEFTDTGEPKLDEGILKTLPGEVAPAVLRFRRLRKWTSAYLQHFLNERDSTGRVHASINTTAARTGRMSITGPPLQTLPRGTEIRDCVIPSPGRKLLAVDYDTMELRMLASFAGETELIAAFEQGVDLHTYAASKVYNKPMSEVTKHERQITKNTQYGLIYGAGPAKLAQTAGVPEQEARDFLGVYHDTFPGVKGFMETVVNTGRVRASTEGNGYITTTGGRRVPTEPDNEYKLVNYLIQGSCADIFKAAVLQVDHAGLGEYLLLPVHDELLFDVPEEEFDDIRVAVEGCMANSDFPVKLTVHASEPLSRWGDVSR